ncbi:MAG: ABC transporter permease [Syntrophothermus sp.]
MFNNRVLAVFKREIREKLLSKSFIIMTVLIPVFIFAIIGIQAFLMNFEGDDTTSLVFISENEEIINTLRKDFSEKDDNIKADYYTLDSTPEQFIENHNKDLVSEKLTGIIYIPETSLKDKSIKYYSKNPNNIKLFKRLEGKINNILLTNYFKGIGLTAEQKEYTKKTVDFNGYRVSEDNKVSEEGIGNTVLAFLFTFLLYMSLLLIGTQMMRSVVEEKNNRIVEILLSSVSSKELMMGKVLGVSATGLMQMIIWLLPVIIVTSSAVFLLPPDLILSLSPVQILFFLLNYFIGLLTYLGLFACVGSMFDNDQDAQSGVWPLMMLIMIPFFIALSMQTNPNSEIAKISSMLPFASIIVMPSRLTLIEVPMWQIVLSIFVNIVTLAAVIPLAGKIYRIGILITGRKPKWGEIAKWIRA